MDMDYPFNDSYSASIVWGIWCVLCVRALVSVFHKTNPLVNCRSGRERETLFATVFPHFIASYDARPLQIKWGKTVASKVGGPED